IQQARETLEKLLTPLQSAPVERDRFASHFYQSRIEYRRTCETAGKSGTQIERCVIASFRIAESMGFKGEFRQWEDLLWIGELRLLASRKVVQTKLQGRAGFAWPVFATADCPPLPGRA
ncbi:MAG: hypothetical protein WA376_22475, partial [Terrimicrobiaceae bacterium]